MTTGATILVFLKAPVAGNVKSRLAESIGAQRAAELYRGWIGNVLMALQPLRPANRVIGYFAGGPRERFAEWRRLADDWWPQPDGDLGERLDFGFRRAHDNGGPVIAVGTDCLELDAALMAQALDALQRHDVVFGPASDGGYYLVGTAHMLPGFFQGVRWSSRQTLADHRERCRQHGWSAALLPERHDIDTWDDWQAYLQRRDQVNGE